MDYLLLREMAESGSFIGLLLLATISSMPPLLSSALILP
jgi:hypothetical protein